MAKFHRWLCDTLRPFLKWASGKHLPFTHKLITGKEYYKALPFLKPGSILLTKIRGDLTSLIIPGYWSHAAIYAPQTLGNINEFVIEAEGPGVVRTDLVSFLLSKDYFMILEPVGIPDEVMGAAADLAVKQLGKPYDYELEFKLANPDSFYCSCLVWWSYASSCSKFKFPCPFVPKMELGVETISPDNIAQSRNFVIKYDSRIH